MCIQKASMFLKNVANKKSLQTFQTHNITNLRKDGLVYKRDSENNSEKKIRSMLRTSMTLSVVVAHNFKDFF